MARPRERFIEPGTRHGRTVVLYEVEGVKPRKLRMKCDCGNEHTSNFGDVFAGDVGSCGCLRQETLKRGLHATHGLNDRPEYPVWNMMKARCHNPNNEKYADYGGRGISVCVEWRESFEAFFANMGPRPSPKHSIERIDNDRGYEPGNCRWATAKEQARNKRNTRMLTMRGETHPLQVWAEALNMDPDLIHQRLAYGWSVEKALTRPKRIWPSKSPSKSGQSHQSDCS